MPFDPHRIQHYKNQTLKTLKCRVSSCSKWTTSIGGMRRHIRSQHLHRYNELVVYFLLGKTVTARQGDPAIHMSSSSDSTSSSSSWSLSPIPVPVSPSPSAAHSNHSRNSSHSSPVGDNAPEGANHEGHRPGNESPASEVPATYTQGSILVEDVESGPWMHDNDSREVDEDAKDMDLPPASITYHTTINGT